MHSYKRKVRKRRMPGEKLSQLIRSIDIGGHVLIWMPQFEVVFFKVLRYEYYLSRIPDDLMVPRYHNALIRIIYRILNQISRDTPRSTWHRENPVRRIKDVMEYLIESDFERRQNLLNRHPITEAGIRKVLNPLKKQKEI